MRCWDIVGPALFCSQDQQKLKLKRDDQESVRNVQLKDANSAQVCVLRVRVQVGCVAPPLFVPPALLQRLQQMIREAQASLQQHQMARQKSQRFLRLNNNQ